MKLSKPKPSALFVVFYIAIFVSASIVSVRAQGGNVVSGQVTGMNNQPIYDATVELLNDYGSAVRYTRTDGSGRYFFGGLSQGRFGVRVRPLEPEYEEQTQNEEIVNLPREGLDGSRTMSATEHKQLDFRMRVRKDFLGVPSAVFAQDVPANAKALFEKAVTDLNEKKEKEGLAGLKAAIEAFPKYYAALERLGIECIRLKQYPVSVTLLQLAVDVNPRSYRSWYGLAHSLNALGYIDEALPAVKKALELYGGSTEAMLLAGVVYKSKKQFPDSEKMLLKAKELSKDEMLMVNWHLALLYKEMKRFGDAARELKSYLKKQPDSKDAEMIKKLITEFDEKAKAN